MGKEVRDSKKMRGALCANVEVLKYKLLAVLAGVSVAR